MLTELEIRAKAQRVVDATKASAHVDTGALRRSISYTYVNNVVIFRQLFYGVYYDNAKLERNARLYMPSEVQWTIVNTDTNGREVNVGSTGAGKIITKLIKRGLGTQTTTRIREAIARKIARETIKRIGEIDTPF